MATENTKNTVTENTKNTVTKKKKTKTQLTQVTADSVSSSLLKHAYDWFINPIKDIRVWGWLAITGILAYLLDPQGLRVITIILYVMFFWTLSLAIRKIMLTYRQNKDEDGDGLGDPLSLSDFMQEAYRGNLAAAVVVLGQLLFMIAIALSFIMWVR